MEFLTLLVEDVAEEVVSPPDELNERAGRPSILDDLHHRRPQLLIVRIVYRAFDEHDVSLFLEEGGLSGVELGDVLKRKSLMSGGITPCDFGTEGAEAGVTLHKSTRVIHLGAHRFETKLAEL